MFFILLLIYLHLRMSVLCKQYFPCTVAFSFLIAFFFLLDRSVEAITVRRTSPYNYRYFLCVTSADRGSLSVCHPSTVDLF